MTTQEKGIVIVGAGNIAWHLGRRLAEQKIPLKAILNRTEKKGKDLATELGTVYRSDWQVEADQASLVILAVSDAAMNKVIERLNVSGCPVVHTAGSMPMEILQDKFESHGVLYPFQTLTKGVACEFSTIPLCIEASDEKTLEQLSELGHKLSNRVYILSSEQRKHLHLAGVIVNNFTNHFIARSADYMKKKGLDVDLIQPLLNETLHKLEKTSAYKAQTGPARRNDRVVIQEHLAMLSGEPELKNLYSLITDSIIAYYTSD